MAVKGRNQSPFAVASGIAVLLVLGSCWLYPLLVLVLHTTFSVRQGKAVSKGSFHESDLSGLYQSVSNFVSLFILFLSLSSSFLIPPCPSICT